MATLLHQQLSRWEHLLVVSQCNVTMQCKADLQRGKTMAQLTSERTGKRVNRLFWDTPRRRMRWLNRTARDESSRGSRVVLFSRAISLIDEEKKELRRSCAPIRGGARRLSPR